MIEIWKAEDRKLQKQEAQAKLAELWALLGRIYNKANKTTVQFPFKQQDLYDEKKSAEFWNAMDACYVDTNRLRGLLKNVYHSEKVK